MTIKLLAFDLDGTAILNHKELPEENRQALEDAAAQGILLVPATGRMLDFLPAPVLALGASYAITANGGAVYRLPDREPVIQNLIPNEKARDVLRVLEDYDIYIEYYSNGKAITRRDMPSRARTHYALPESKWGFVDGKDYTLVDSLSAMLEETGLRPEKINLPYLKDHQKRELWARLDALGGLRLTSSISDNLEINSAQAHKGGALLAWAQQLGLKPDELMAIGDNGNDVTMLEAAGCSVAVADGSAEARAAAKFGTAPHDQNGLAQAVRRFALGQGMG